MTADPAVREAAEAALRAIFRKPPLRFQRSQITTHAAVFAFQALAKVDKASRLSAGLFKLWSPVPVRSLSAIPRMFVKAVIEATKDPDAYKRSAVGSTIAIVHRRNLQAHLLDPDTFPCPQFR